MDKEREIRARTVQRLLYEGVFIAKEDLVFAAEAHIILTGKRIEILGNTLKNNVTTSNPEKIIGVKLDVEGVREYDSFWSKFLELKAAHKNKHLDFGSS